MRLYEEHKSIAISQLITLITEPVPGELRVPAATGGHVHPVWRLGHRHDHEDADRGAARVPCPGQVHRPAACTHISEAARSLGATLRLVWLDALQASYYTNSLCQP